MVVSDELEVVIRDTHRISKEHGVKLESVEDWIKGSIDRGTEGAESRIRSNTAFRHTCRWALKIAGGVVITASTAAVLAMAFGG